MCINIHPVTCVNMWMCGMRMRYMLWHVYGDAIHYIVMQFVQVIHVTCISICHVTYVSTYRHTSRDVYPHTSRDIGWYTSRDIGWFTSRDICWYTSHVSLERIVSLYSEMHHNICLNIYCTVSTYRHTSRVVNPHWVMSHIRMSHVCHTLQHRCTRGRLLIFRLSQLRPEKVRRSHCVCLCLSMTDSNENITPLRSTKSSKLKFRGTNSN